jgi:hypothetical protein
MQTKIRFLKKHIGSPKSRSGVALITAVFLMILISMMLLKMLSYTSDAQQRTVNEYLNEQAILLTYSATEYAVLAITGTNPINGCIDTINSTYPSAANPIFNITTTIKYVWSNNAILNTASGDYRLSNLPASCKGTQHLLAEVATPEEHGAALIDVVVTSAPGLNLKEEIRFHRRTLQKL